MANIKISDLTSAASVADANQFEINEAGTSKKVTGSQIKAYVNSGDGALASKNTVATADIDNSAVTSAKIADGTIVAGDIANSTITGAKIATDTITATNIAANAVGASELNVSGNGTTSQFLRSDGDGTFTWAAPGGGKILQVVQTTFTGTQSVSTPSNGYFTNITNLQASITPSSTSSKILIMLNASVMHPNDKIIHVKMSGGNSASFIGNSASNRARAASWVSAQAYSAQMMSLTYLDSPSTTSSITYIPQMGANAAGTTWTINYNVINDSDQSYITRGASSMILMEVAG